MEKITNKMKNMMVMVAAALTALVVGKTVTKTAEVRRRYQEDERGVDIIVMIVVLAILISIAVIFRDQMTAFVNRMFTDILAF